MLLGVVCSIAGCGTRFRPAYIVGETGRGKIQMTALWFDDKIKVAHGDADHSPMTRLFDAAQNIRIMGFMVDDLQATYEALKAQEIFFSLPPTQQNSGVTLAVFHDPDGLGITIQQR
jgi:catechol 2,3-dioxygenase-like lactoylglutathione lyase family enzyme